MKWVIREKQKQISKYNAGSKARNDVDSILVMEGYKPLDASLKLDESQNALKKVILQFSRYSEWKKSMNCLQSGDTVVIQYPVRNHTVFLEWVLKSMKKKGVCIIGIIHDLESLRLALAPNSPLISKYRFKYEEISALKYFDRIIVHNKQMKIAINQLFDVPIDKMIELGIFDYLSDFVISEKSAYKDGPVLIAGNLDKRKSGYVYNLPKEVIFNLYGANYDQDAMCSDNIQYMGKVEPNELPGILKGSFGLVWDGPSSNTCEGIYGEYLKINNPHKISLYLASGLPVIVWSKSAMAHFVIEYHCGIVIDDLHDLNKLLMSISDEQYEQMKKCAMKIGKDLRAGMHTRMACEG